MAGTKRVTTGVALTPTVLKPGFQQLKRLVFNGRLVDLQWFLIVADAIAGPKLVQKVFI